MINKCYKCAAVAVVVRRNNKQGVRPPQYAPAPCKFTFDLLTLKVVSESRLTWATSMPILVFLDLSVLDLGSMYATDRRASSLNASALWGGDIIIVCHALLTTTIRLRVDGAFDC